MSVFTDAELEFLASQRLGRIATVGKDGQPHVVPTSFRHNPELDVIEVGGLRMGQPKKVRDVRRTGKATIVVDDVRPPWRPRMIEIRGTAEVVETGGKEFGVTFDTTVMRISPTRIVAFGIEDDEASKARDVAS
jgi:pyridoxamine 5'-phosphate oxidase family protein